MHTTNMRIPGETLIMNKTTLVCATLICLYGQAYAQDAQPAKAAVQTAKPVAVTKTAQPVIANKPVVANKPVIAAKPKATKSAAKSTTKAVKPVAKAKSNKKVASPSLAKAAKPVVAAQPAVNPYLPTRPANPYLVNVPAKAEAVANPYLANVPAKSVFASSNPYLTPAVTNPGSKSASAPKTSTPKNKVAAQALTNRQISFGAMPMKIYLASGSKPIVAITLPCSAVEKSWNWFPPFTMGERMMFGMVGNVNEADFLPMKIEPVCT
jgi:hypothetical protein